MKGCFRLISTCSKQIDTTRKHPNKKKQRFLEMLRHFLTWRFSKKKVPEVLLGWRGSPETDSPISIEAKDGGGEGPCVHCAAGTFFSPSSWCFLEVGQLRDSRWAEGMKLLVFFWKFFNLNGFSPKNDCMVFGKTRETEDAVTGSDLVICPDSKSPHRRKHEA